MMPATILPSRCIRSPTRADLNTGCFFTRSKNVASATPPCGRSGCGSPPARAFLGGHFPRTRPSPHPRTPHVGRLDPVQRVEIDLALFRQQRPHRPAEVEPVFAEHLKRDRLPSAAL